MMIKHFIFSLSGHCSSRSCTGFTGDGHSGYFYRLVYNKQHALFPAFPDQINLTHNTNAHRQDACNCWMALAGNGLCGIKAENDWLNGNVLFLSKFHTQIHFFLYKFAFVELPLNHLSICPYPLFPKAIRQDLTEFKNNCNIKSNMQFQTSDKLR